MSLSLEGGGTDLLPTMLTLFVIMLTLSFNVLALSCIMLAFLFEGQHRRLEGTGTKTSKDQRKGHKGFANSVVLVALPYGAAHLFFNAEAQRRGDAEIF